jgi:hypothetical protein
MMRDMALTNEVTRTGRCMAFTRHGIRHRIDGPAIFTDYGSFTYYQYGEKHRLNGKWDERDDNDARYYRRGVIVYDAYISNTSEQPPGWL